MQGVFVAHLGETKENHERYLGELDAERLRVGDGNVGPEVKSGHGCRSVQNWMMRYNAAQNAVL